MEASTPKKILIVDDEEGVLTALTHILKRAEYEVASAVSGGEALALTKQFLPDLIILDVLLPDMMGGEVWEKLAQDHTTSRIPIIFLTGLNTKEDELILKEKAHSFHSLAKPVTREEILEAISKVLSDQ